jgi:hypothetical protein
MFAAGATLERKQLALVTADAKDPVFGHSIVGYRSCSGLDEINDKAIAQYDMKERV